MTMSSPGLGEELLVRWQETPNPYAIKFIVNQALKSHGKATFHSGEECEGLPLVRSLLEIPGVKQCYLFENKLTVTHDGTLPAEDLIDNVTAVLKTRFAVHDPDFEDTEPSVENKTREADRSNLSPEQQRIEEILDRTIRPGLQADGGDVEVISWENNELRILYQGACGGCPSAMMGTLEAIQNILRHELQNDELIVVPI